ncbi:MAG: DUF4003 family protein [Bacillota bacterium]
MDDYLEILRVFEDNVSKLKKRYRWRFDSKSIALVSLEFALSHQPLDLNLFERVSQTLSKKLSPFSTLKQSEQYFIAASLIIKTDDPIAAIDEFLTQQKALMKEGMIKETVSYYLALMLVEKQAPLSCVGSANQLYRRLKHRHSFMLNRTIFPFVFKISVEQQKNKRLQDEQAIVEVVESNYDELVKHGFKAGTHLYVMSMVFSLPAFQSHLSHAIQLYKQLAEVNFTIEPEQYLSFAILSHSSFEKKHVIELEMLVDDLLKRTKIKQDKKLQKQLAMHMLLIDYLPHQTGVNQEVLTLAYELIEVEHMAIMSAVSSSSIGLY